MVKMLLDPGRSSLVDVEALPAKVESRYLSCPLVDEHVSSCMTINVVPQVSSCLIVSGGKS